MDHRHPAAPRQDRPLGSPLTVVTAFALIALLGLTTVWGAMASNQHYGATLRAEYEQRTRVADELGVELADINRGYTTYMTTCISCHGERGEALPNLGKDLGSSEFIGAQSDTQLLMFVKLGRGTWEADNTTGVAMPPKGGNPMLTDDDLKDIICYLRYLQAAK